MLIINFPSQQPDSPFYEDNITEGYHIYSLKNAKIPVYYPDEFLDNPDISIKDIIAVFEEEILFRNKVTEH